MFVVCDSRVPAACQALADEQNILGRIVFKSRNSHRRHRHHNYLTATFKALDVLLNNVDSLELKKLAQSVVDSGNALKPTAEPLATLGNQEAAQLMRSLEALQGHAQSLQDLTKVACASFHPMVRLGFFVPFALCATALLGRVYTLSGEICDAVSSATLVLTPAPVTAPVAIEPPAGPAAVVSVPKPVQVARPDDLDDEDMGVPLEAEEAKVMSEAPQQIVAAEEPQEVAVAEVEVSGMEVSATRRRRPTSFPRAWSRPLQAKQVPRLTGRPWRRLLRIANSIVKKQRVS